MNLLEATLTALAMIMTPATESVSAEIEISEFTTINIKYLAIELEIADPREEKYLFVRPEDLLGDVNLIRRRWADLKDAPPLADSYRFPIRDTCNSFLSFNRQFRQVMENRQELSMFHWDDIKKVLDETDRRYRIWDTVRDIRCEYYYVSIRRLAMKKLLEILGPDDYYSGKIPPHVPLEYFLHMD
jgi:hypothetical protein